MRLPQQLLNSQFFQFNNVDELLGAAQTKIDAQEALEVRRVAALGLPPASSIELVALMLGVHPALIWSFEHKAARHYRIFEIPKGQGFRTIEAPRVALKVLQKWFAVHLADAIAVQEHVFGFVSGRSHIQAAKRHVGARWAMSFDLQDFFPSTPQSYVCLGLRSLGYSSHSAAMLSSMFCLGGYLAQGAPTSPCISNLCFRDVDRKLAEIQLKNRCTLTRYADDIVFSGLGQVPSTLSDHVESCIEGTPWKLSASKSKLQPLKGRIKIHGLLVQGDELRLTKRYRNKMRAHRHIVDTRGDLALNRAYLKGHINYENAVMKVASTSVFDLTSPQMSRPVIKQEAAVEFDDAQTDKASLSRIEILSNWIRSVIKPVKFWQ